MEQGGAPTHAPDVARDDASGVATVDQATRSLSVPIEGSVGVPLLDSDAFLTEGGPRHPGVAVGSSIGRFLVLGRLGRGGMGVVYEAFDRQLDRRVAVKVLQHDVPSERSRLLREAQALAQLSHPNVVQVYDVGVFEGRTFLAMELVQGQTLRRWAKQTPPPDWRTCVEIYLQAGAGLAAAHERGLVHRDFKPSNAIVDDGGRVRVLDFGLARVATDTSEGELRTPSQPSTAVSEDELPPALDRPDAEDRLTKTGLVLGTPPYMPLEQLRGEEVDARSDQFSFCVALHEAVYGQRPFAGRTIAQARQSRLHDRLVAVPPDSAAPTRLHEILRRGLRHEPAQRWPSMPALLEQLQALVAPRASRGTTALRLGLVGGLGLVGAGLLWQTERAHEVELARQAALAQRCTGSAEQLEGIWDDGTRQRVEQAILATALPYAAPTWSRVDERLSSYARRWIETHTAVCEATRVTQVQTEAEMHLRMGCLRRHRAALQATVEVLARADAPVVDEAVRLVADLPDLARCDDVEALEHQRERTPPPDDPRVAERVEALRNRLTEIRAEQDASRFAPALQQVEAVVDQARALQYPPLLAEALMRRGQLRDDAGQYEPAEHDLVEAFELATTHGHDDAALEAATALVFVVGYHQARHAAGRQWSHVALPLAERRGDPRELASVTSALGSVLFGQHALAEAEQQLRRTLALREQALGPEHPDVISSLSNLGSILASQGQYDEAEQLLRRAITLREQVLGADHPEVPYGLNNLGLLLSSRGRHVEAEQLFRRALAQWAQTLGPEHPDLAIGLENLGLALERQGRHADAREPYTRALKIETKAMGETHPNLAYPLLGLARAALGLRDFATARAHAARALAILEQTLPDQLAEPRYVLAQALWEDDPSQRARARTLAEQAFGAMQLPADADDPEAAAHLAEVERWLAAHPPP